VDYTDSVDGEASMLSSSSLKLHDFNLSRRYVCMRVHVHIIFSCFLEKNMLVNNVPHHLENLVELRSKLCIIVQNKGFNIKNIE
jgi:hypothetical protein